jgi:hypothetical protein
MLCLVLLCSYSATALNSILEYSNSDSSPPLPPGYSYEQAEKDARSNSILEGEDLAESGQGLAVDASDTIQLYAGWNQISVPRWLSDGHNHGIDVFGDVDTGGHSIFTYNAQTGQWVQMMSNDIVVPLEGIWIYSTSLKQVSLYYAVSQPIPTKMLYTGWNLIGYWDLAPFSARETLISRSEMWVKVNGYDAIHQVQESSIFNTNPSYNSLMYPKKGYWLLLTDTSPLVPLIGTKDNQDQNYPQVGVIWGNAYIPPSAPLYWSDVTANNFYENLGSNGWRQMFTYGDNAAQEAQFSPPLDWYNVDGVDLAFYAGHGENYALNLPTLRMVWFSSCEWGDNDLEWIILHGCHTTQTPQNFKQIPHRAMNGVHLVCGYISEGYDCENGETGSTVSNFLLTDNTVKNSWCWGVDWVYNEPITLRTVGEVATCANDHIWGHGTVISDPPVDNYYNTWGYACHPPN